MSWNPPPHVPLGATAAFRAVVSAEEQARAAHEIAKVLRVRPGLTGTEILAAILPECQADYAAVSSAAGYDPVRASTNRDAEVSACDLHVALYEMLRRGFVERDRDGRYSPRRDLK